MKITDNRTGKSKEVPERFGKILTKLPRYSTRNLVAETAPDAPKRRGRPPKVQPDPQATPVPQAPLPDAPIDDLPQ